MIPIYVFEKRTVALFGLGLSGVASARALVAGGARVIAWDDNEAARTAAASEGVEVTDLHGVNWNDLAALVLAPGVPLTHPEPHWTVRMARSAGIEIIGDTELFFRERDRLKSGARVVAITGTNGKSTTSALMAHILTNARRETALGGNIGTAILDLPQLADDRAYVVEFSSYQIDLTPTLRADAAALLNITPDHLDRHGTFENYSAVKARVFSGLTATGCAVVGIDDEPCRKIAATLTGPYEVRQVSVTRPVDNGVYVSNGTLRETRDGQESAFIELTGIGSLRGEHNAQNAAAAFALARSIGLETDEIEKGLRSFPGLEHRMEQVGRRGNVLFVNDSKGTNADAAAHALASFENIFWIAGGLAKEGGIAGLSEYFPRIAHAYLIGEAADDFSRVLKGHVNYTVCGTLDRAVQAAAVDAASSDAGEPVVLLSPACASFDQFRSFAVRGDAFKQAVSKLEGIVLSQSEAA